jgi:hypothetical protein
VFRTELTESEKIGSVRTQSRDKRESLLLFFPNICLHPFQPREA